MRAVIGTHGADAYTAAKGGVLSMSRALAMQWADKGIRINVLAPGVVLTERVKKLVTPDNPIYRKSLLGPSEQDHGNRHARGQRCKQLLTTCRRRRPGN